MASIYVYNLKGGKCVELNNPRIESEDVERLKALLPTNLEGLAFESPLHQFSEAELGEVKIEAQESRVAEYLRSIGSKLEQLHQVSGAMSFYDLAFRVSGKSDYLILKARMLRQAGHMDKAERLLTRYSEDNPEAPEPYYLKGKNALSRSDYQSALEHFERALSFTRASNVEHKRLRDILSVYLRFVSIYLERDQIFARDLNSEECQREIKHLLQQTQKLSAEIPTKKIGELDGMIFFLETQEKLFQRWLEELTV